MYGMYADSINSSSYFSKQDNCTARLKSAVKTMNSMNGVIVVGTGIMGFKEISSVLPALVLDFLATKASSSIDAQENPKSGIAIGCANVVTAGLYGYLLQGLISPFSFSLSGVLWGIKGTKCLLTATCQFVLAGKQLTKNQ